MPPADEIEKRPLNLLMVEDCEEDAFLLTTELRRHTFDVHSVRVETEAEMRAMLSDRSWDVITSDHKMPAFSAPDALSVANELAPDVPLIVVSGEIDLDLAVSLMKHGARDYIRKSELAMLGPAIHRELADAEIRLRQKCAQQALRDSEERYRRSFDSAPIGMFHSTGRGQYLDVNQSLADMFGFDTPDEMIRYVNPLGIAKAICVQPSDRDQIVGQAKDRKGWSHQAIDGRRKDGSIIHCNISMRAFGKTESGDVLLEGFAENMSGQVAAENALRDSEGQFEEIYNAVSDGILVIDAETHQVLHVNRAVGEMHGLALEQCYVDDVLKDKLSGEPYGVEAAEQYFRKALTEGPQRFDWLAKHASGRLFWVEIVMKAAMIGRRNLIICLIRDIDQKKKDMTLLAKEEALMRTLVESSPDGLALLELDGVVTRCNDRHIRLLGFASETSVVGHKLAEFVSPGERDLVAAYLDRCKELGRAGPFAIDIEVPGNGQLKAELLLNLICDGEGQPSAIMSTVRDITRRIELNAALLESEAKLRLITDNMVDVVCRVNEFFEIEYVSPSVTRTLGYRPSHLIGRKLEHFIHEEDRSKLLRVKERTNSGIADPTVLDMRHVSQDGCHVCMETLCHPLVDHARGFLGAVLTMRDATERQSAIESLQRSEARFRHIFDHSVIGLFQTTLDGKLITANRAMTQIFGYDDFDSASSGVTDAASQHYANALDREAFVAAVMATDNPVRLEMSFVKKDGTPFSGSVSAWQSATDDGEPCIEGMVDVIVQRQ